VGIPFCTLQVACRGVRGPSGRAEAVGFDCVDRGRWITWVVFWPWSEPIQPLIPATLSRPNLFTVRVRRATGDGRIDQSKFNRKLAQSHRPA